MSKNNKSKVTFRNIILELLDGLTKHFAGQTIVLNGVSVKPADLATKWQAYLAAVAVADATRAVWLGQVDVAKKLAPAVRDDVNAIHNFLRGMYGLASPTLDDFGMTPRRAVATRTSAEKAASAQKSLATRVVRHTLGPKQKATIHGSAPAAAPAALAPSNAPKS